MSENPVTGILELESEEEKQDSPEKDWNPILSEEVQKGQKYFDSGDYNMAKAKMKSKRVVTAGADKNLVTGDHIPTPQDLQRKATPLASKLTG